MTAAPTPPLDADLFGEGPAREPCVVVKDRWAECVNLPDGHPEQLTEFLHRQMNEEANVLENAARNLADFPDADWGIRMWLARQCADEARHALIYKRFLADRGGRVGQYPVLNFQYKILGKIDNLLGRLVVQNRTFEADGLDAATFGIGDARRRGDAELAALYEAQAADEVVHIRFANEWIRRQIAQAPVQVLRMAAALTQAARGFAMVFADGGANVTKYGVDERGRLDAGFAPEEVQVAAERAAARRVALGSQPA